MSEGLLAGLRVIEIASWVSGPATGLLLAEAGADVIKIEPPGGDPARATPGFATWNRSKRSVTLDLHTEQGAAALRELLSGADMLVHSLRPAAARRFGLDEETLAARHPQLVWCAITGWPAGHPHENRPGYDILIQAETGVMDEELGTRPGPVFLRFPFASWNAAFIALAGLLARLRLREATGRGGGVRTSVFQGALAPMSKHWARAETPTPQMSFANLAKGMNFTSLCGDGLCISTPGMMDTPLSSVPLFQDVYSELPAEIAANPMLAQAEVLKRRTRAQWLEAMAAADAPAVPVAERLGEALRQPQARINLYAVEVDDPDHGKTVQVGHPFHVSPPLAVRGPAPRLGAHTREVLQEKRAPRAAGAPKPAPRFPLEGVKVLDFGMFLAGPYGPQLMADLGAEVIKVEAPTGDRLRNAERVFSGCQRGKRSIAIDLRSPQSRPALEKLIRWADVVHHNLRMPPARLLGLGYESVRAIKPSIVYCHVSSYGPQGPWKDWPGVDPTSQAVVGWMQEGAGRGNPPRWYRIGMTDDQCAINSVSAVLLALRHRDRTGEGADVRGSIFGTALLTTSETMLLPDGAIAPYPSMDSDQTGLGPGYRIYQCADGWLAVVAIGEAALAALRQAAGAESVEALPAAFRKRAVGEMAAALGAAGVEAEPVRMENEQAFFDSPLYRRLGLTCEYPHPIYGRLEQIGAVLGFNDFDLKLDRAPPALGQHTSEILAEVGLSGDEIAALAKAGLLAGA